MQSNLNRRKINYSLPLLFKFPKILSMKTYILFLFIFCLFSYTEGKTTPSPSFIKNKGPKTASQTDRLPESEKQETENFTPPTDQYETQKSSSPTQSTDEIKMLKSVKIKGKEQINEKPSSLQPVSQTNKLVLKDVLQNYHLKSLQLKIEQEIFLSAIRTSMKSQGHLDIQGEKFYLKLEGDPSSILLFDGEFLWYQASTSEKTVFKLKEHPQIQILNGLFSEKKFFEAFRIKRSRKQNQDYVFELKVKKEIEKLSKIFVKTNNYISEVRLVWKDLDNWQKYKFSKPLPKEFPVGHFQFSPSGFQIITKI